eukprot:TRINITY_DN70103_c0_g1_i1.p1 TRINITY_DN70103_c0_g1~~TRINITY_DN70103_c0_g1_i1.p1  ORF type:complete len:340 (+),score=132.78 TRINITY_DN70103_c0_g1_i1:99-1022(+)
MKASRVTISTATRRGLQRRTFFPPQIAITGMPLQDHLVGGGGTMCSFVAWERRVAPRSKEAESKFGAVGCRVNLDKCEDPGFAKVDQVVFNTYEGGSFVTRNDNISGPENEKVYEEWPTTEEKYRKVYLKPPAKDEYERRVKHYALLMLPRAAAAVIFKTAFVSFILSCGPRADMKAAATTELNIDWLEEGQMTVTMWQGKPCFIHHRTQKDIEKANAVSVSELRDPETDAERHKNPKYAVMVAICTHLGCIPVFGDGDYGAYLCPCHGSHYDVSGRIRKGPAPLNLEVPPYYWADETTVVIGKAEP